MALWAPHLVCTKIYVDTTNHNRINSNCSDQKLTVSFSHIGLVSSWYVKHHVMYLLLVSCDYKGLKVHDVILIYRETKLLKVCYSCAYREVLSFNLNIAVFIIYETCFSSSPLFSDYMFNFILTYWYFSELFILNFELIVCDQIKGRSSHLTFIFLPHILSTLKFLILF